MSAPERAIRSSIGAPVIASLVLFALGQLILFVFAPLSRATTSDAVLGGLVLLSSDSYGYLERGSTWADIRTETWNRRGFLTLVRVGWLLGTAELFVVGVQSLLLVIAGALLFDIARRRAGLVAGVAAAGVLLVNPMVSQWTRFVLSEAIFYALVVFAVWAGDRFLERRGGSLPLILVGLLVATVRPNGILVAGACLAILLARVQPAAKRRLMIAAAWAGVGAGLVLGLNDGASRYGWDTAAFTTQGVVIEGLDHVATSVSMPPPEQPIMSEADLLRYALSNPVAIARLALARMLTETVQVRRHYPNAVNLAVGAAMVAYFLAVTVGLGSLGRSRLTSVALNIALPLLLLVGATFAVPEGRFGWAYMLPFAPHAGIGVARAVRATRALLRRAARLMAY